VALREYPRLNAYFAGHEIHIHNHINIGVAVARENGLVTVVIRDCDTKPLAQIAGDARAVIGRVREGQLKADDMVGATFTISNMGMYGVEDFVAIISPAQQAGILAVGGIRQTPVVNAEGELVAGTRMKITVSADHRVTDGVEAALFLKAVKAALEEPMRLVI
jgi:pyruvate dehydrogenase E2 component (dihydrolipoamide acetyltransferase)